MIRSQPQTLTAIVLFLLISCSPREADHAVTPAAAFEGGYRYSSGSLHILSLRGSYREMGRQYGGLEATVLREFHADIMDLLVRKRGVPEERLLRYARKLYQGYPRRAREIILGMSETSGLSLPQHQVVNAFEHYLFNRQFSHARGPGGFSPRGTVACSAIAAWGPYTGNKELVFGRNYDFGTDVGGFVKYVNVAVFNPAGSGVPTAVVTFTGTLNATTEMNASGLFLELNNGGVSAGGRVAPGRLSAPVSLFTMLLDFEDMERLDRAMQTIGTDAPFIINVAGETAAVSYEWAPEGLKRAPPSHEGLMVSTNHFTGPWGDAPPKDSFFMTVTRRRNLLALAEKQRGAIDLEAMKTILDTPLEGGGASSFSTGTVNGNPLPYTAFQVIAIPASRTLWLRVAGSREWTGVSLTDYFR
ncbi:MAG: hypothetical protein JXA20_05620 [Spirochaetes bacterium]|nr:hypothetical protein [Spirochaetota bacterium]